MKTILRMSLTAVLLMLMVVFFLALASCTTVTGPDGTVTKSPDAVSVVTGADLAKALIATFAKPKAAAPAVVPEK